MEKDCLVQIKNHRKYIHWCQRNIGLQEIPLIYPIKFLKKTQMKTNLLESLLINYNRTVWCSEWLESTVYQQ